MLCMCCINCAILRLMVSSWSFVLDPVEMSVLLWVSCCFGLVGRTQLLKCLFVLTNVIYVTTADLSEHQPEILLASANAPLSYPAIPGPRLPGRSLSQHKLSRKHLAPHGSRLLLPPVVSPPNYSPLVFPTHPPRSLRMSKPPIKKSGSEPPAPALDPPSLVDVSPTNSGAAPVPYGLAEPPLSPSTSECCKPDTILKRGSQGCQCVYPMKIDLLLLNVSTYPNWTLFLEELASQLGLRVSQIELINFYVLSLSRLNISMDITPHTGISFSADAAQFINSSLSLHRVHLNPALVGDYKLLNITWFKPSVLAAAESPKREPQLQPSSKPTSPTPSNDSKHSDLILLVGIGVGILIILIAAVVICSCRWNHRKPTSSLKESEKPKTTDTISVVESLPHPASMRFLEYEELKEATNNFETASILGEGGFGRVFKGVLRDGTAVAIKRLSSGGQQGNKEFLVEVEMLSRLHHRNLVKLVGYYSNRDASQNLLCYELVPNGSLEDWLHGPMGVNCALDWDSRMMIALDAARGLAYLHEDSQPCVIHRDFKASNILLENNFHAKVADFGLAKLAPEGRQNYLSTRVMGTFGYVAPEYAMTGHLLVKSDVYSYGVVLLELLTGRKPVDMSQPSGQENLVTWARPILRDRDRLEELADPRLEGKYPKEDFLRVCTVAAACVSPEASQRPTMGEVVQSLKMVQRVTEYQDSMMGSSNPRPNLRQSSTTFESDGTSSIFSSGPYSGLSGYENISRTAVFSEDLHEGR